MMSMSYRTKMMLFWLVVAVSMVSSTYIFVALGMGQFFGWVYSLAFAMSGAPQAKKSIEDGHAEGVAAGTLFLWMLGEIGGFIYGISLMQWPIIFNCLLNIVFVGMIVWYRLFPRPTISP